MTEEIKQEIEQTVNQVYNHTISTDDAIKRILELTYSICENCSEVVFDIQ